MAIRIIRTSEDAILRKRSREVTEFDSRLHALLDDMADTMHDAGGVGLAAPQVGVLKRVVVVDIGDENGVTELVNPAIIYRHGEVVLVEGCLSVPNVRGYMRRPEKVKVRAFDRHGNEHTYTGEGMLAQAFCHEVEHLNGQLFIDKMEGLVEE